MPHHSFWYQNIQRMDYQKFAIEDFVLDKEFRKWVLANDEESNTFWNDWIQKNPAKLSDIQEARKILKNLRFPDYQLSTAEKEDIFEVIDNRIRKSEPTDIPLRYLDVDTYKKIPRWPRWSTGIAASLLIGLAATVWLLIGDSNQGQLAYQTDFAETKEVLLKDGSRVILNANSKLYIGEMKSDTTIREVWLEGEAFFQVEHTANHQKFVVHANKIDVNVIGTTFNVYNRGKKAQIELATGKVRLDNQATQQRLEMIPGDKVSFESAYEDPALEKVNPKEVSAWKENLLIFRRSSLEEIAGLLKANYDIDVFFTDGASSDNYFTGTAPADDIDLLLETLSRSFDLRIVRKDQTIIIKPNPKAE